VEGVVHELNPELPVFNVNPLKVTMKFGTILEHVAAVFAGSFGVLAMLLAAVGIYGVVAYTTRQRTREIGIRMALGAQKGQIYQMVLRQAFVLTLAGLFLGTAVSLMITRFLRSQLYGVSDTDALTFGAVAMLLSAVSLLACHIPAHRATKIEPNIALRCE
jgi:ABC-type antimicrobial peptide transport system permease subunit